MVKKVKEPEDEEWSEQPESPESPAMQRHHATIDKQWMKKYQEVVKFKQINGHCTFSRKAKGSDPNVNRLAKWVEFQRVQFRRGRMRSDRKKLLDDIGFCWKPPIHLFNKEGIFRDDLWNVKYQKLVEFKETHGHCLPMRNDLVDTSCLSRWAEFNRRQWRRGRMPQHRKKLLDDIGFVWKPPIRRDGHVRDAEWKVKYQQLVKFKATHGHCRPSQKGKTNVLYKWVEYNRSQFQEGIMPQDRKKLLDKIGFSWKTKGSKKGSKVNVRTGSGTVRKLNSKAKKKSATKAVTNRASNSRGKQTGAKHRRGQVKDPNKGRPGRKFDHKKWNKMYQQLVAFKRTNGHCLVSSKWDDKILVTWVYQQRQAYRFDKMPDCRKKLLNKIGFCWRPSQKRPQQNSRSKSNDDGVSRLPATRGQPRRGSRPGGKFNDARWMVQYRKLVEFQRTTGHCMVKWGNKLYHWVYYQQTLHRNGTLPQDRKKLLDDIGFCWNPLEHRSLENPSAGNDGETAATLEEESDGGTAGEDESHVDHEPEYDIGTKVHKFCEDRGWLTGEVTSYGNETYSVTYEDGDKVKYNKEDLAKVVLSFSSASEVEIGSRVDVHWPNDGRFYKGTVTKHRARKPSWCVEYDDEDTFEWVDLCNTKFRLLDPDEHSPGDTKSEDESKPSIASSAVLEVETGSRIWVQWPSDKRYHGGTVTQKRKGQKSWRVEYDDGSWEWLNLHKCKFHRAPDGKRSIESKDSTASESDSGKSGFSSLPEPESDKERQGDEGNGSKTTDKTREGKSTIRDTSSPEGQADTSWVGPKVKKFFEGSGWCAGAVTSCNGQEYRVTYDNGESEDYNDQELAKVLFPASVENVKVGSRVAVHRADGLYHEGTVADERNERNPLCIEYKDGSKEWIDLRERRFRLLPGGREDKRAGDKPSRFLGKRSGKHR